MRKLYIEQQLDAKHDAMKPDGTEGFCRAEQEFKYYEEVRMTPEKLGCK